ncbi:MAG: transglycosylase SLT domain-containing protein [Campylobacterales bacterium]|nr:transglycosylase SLT domain-containing protein [Campylobacterales bacterium]
MKLLFSTFFFTTITVFASVVSFDHSDFDKSEVSFMQTLDLDESFLKEKEFQRVKNNYLEYRQEQVVNILSNASIYYPLIKDILKKEGMPEELVYMAMAESAFKNRAYSSAKAVGIWQFMPYTAKLYGLRVDEYVDERRDPIKATYAAIRYMKKLHRQFGKWSLAMMAYNCGEGRLSWAIKKAGSNELNKLLEVKPKRKAYRCKRRSRRFQKCQALPAETRRYIRKIATLASLAESERMLNKHNASYLLNRGISYPMAKVKVPSGTTMDEVARAIEERPSKIKALNATLKYSFVPPYVDNFEIYIPYEKLPVFKEDFKPSANKNKFIVYTVKQGDNLSSIGRKFGIRYKLIKDFNNLRSSFLKLKQKLIIPVQKNQIIKYRVKKGDSLASIAKKYQTSVDRILKLNNRNEKIIYVGEYLELSR